MSAAGILAPARRAPSLLAAGFESHGPAAHLVRAATWSLLANASLHGAGVLGTVIAARQLGPEAFGKFGIINSTVGLASTVGALGVGIAATKYVAEYWRIDPARTRRLHDLTMLVSFVSGLIGSAALYFFAAPVATRALHAPALVPELRLAAPLVLASVLGGAQVGILAGLERFRTLAKVNVVRGVITVPLTAALTAAWGLKGAILSLTAGALGGLAATTLALHHSAPAGFLRPDYVGCWREWRMLTRFSLPSLLSTISFTPVQWAMAAWLVSAPNGFLQMGIYSAGNQIRTLVTYVPSALGQPALAMLSRESSADGCRFRLLYRHVMLLGLGLSVLAGIPVLAGSSWILAVYHPALKGHSAVVSLLILSGIVQVPGWIATVAASSAGRAWTCLYLQGLWAAATLAPGWWLTPRLGALGLAWSLMIGYSIHTAVTLLVVRRAIGARGGVR